MQCPRFLIVIAALHSAPVAALTASAEHQLSFLAGCAGRLSAIMEHQWTHDADAAVRTDGYRAEFVDLVAAITPSDRIPEVRLMRGQAKTAQARLLRRSVATRDPDDARWAQSRVAAMMRECTSVLLPPPA